MPSFEVLHYDVNGLKRLLSELSECPPEKIGVRPHTKYFCSYLEHLQAATILVEKDYIDKDYLDDFAAYYVKCFHSYRRYCNRLHFFKSVFSADDFQGYLERRSSSVTDELLAGTYLGFMVIRPLPQSIVGRSCLTCYSEEEYPRHYPIVHPCHANLFGLDLVVKSIAFQEQDQVTAACATSALWSAFQSTSRLFQHRLPSPVEITNMATAHLPLRSRAFPNTDGLTTEQMAHAIRSVGLEPFYFTPNSPFILKSTVASYLECKIPVLLIVKLQGKDQGEWKDIGFHAVTVVGYSRPNHIAMTGDYPEQPQLASNLIDKLYVHDDQVGPFARMEFASAGSEFYLTTSWGETSGYENVRAIPISLLLPLYHKIRIPHKLVYDYILIFDGGLFSIHSIIPSLQEERPMWHIKLCMLNEFKKEISGRASLPGKIRSTILTRQLPRFIWWASASIDDSVLLDILFDATDIASGKFVKLVIVSDENLATVLRHFKNTPNYQATPTGSALNQILSRVDESDIIVV